MFILDILLRVTMFISLIYIIKETIQDLKNL